MNATKVMTLYLVGTMNAWQSMQKLCVFFIGLDQCGRPTPCTDLRISSMLAWLTFHINGCLKTYLPLYLTGMT